jgi:hypothetical protein
MAAVHLFVRSGTAALIVPTDPQIQTRDTIVGHALDSVVVDSPLPDPLVPIVQWIFQKPGWVMIGGIVLAGAVALAALFLAWRHRLQIRDWLVTRERGVKLALVGTLGAILLLMVGTGVKAYDYMMHDNDFCRGCHIFVPSGQLLVRPDTGTYLLVNRLEGKHDTLTCHACHPFEIRTQTKELIAWMTDRPEQIPPHGKVPREICEECHVTGPAKDTWRRIATTAGHRTHFESDSAALKDVECLTCHARSAHRFQPADSTCAQQGCHFTDSIRIRLGRMSARFDPGQPLPNEEMLYCNSCHQFTADAQFLAPDSATGLLRPASQQCFGCHEMRTLLASFDPAKDPHSGSCGMCHNPHTDVRPDEALTSCADAQCHSSWRDVPFHVGDAHRKVGQRCETCHLPHSARVDASDCVGCHRMVREDKSLRLAPPLPFDTTRALQRSSSLVEPGRARGQGDRPPDDEPPGRPTDVSTSSSDTFPHKRHSRLACLTCHNLGSKGGRLTFEVPRGCQICHHQRPARSDCSTCHQSEELTPPWPVSVRVAVPRHLPRLRDVAFEHGLHDKVECTECHTLPVSLAPADSVRTCASCHADHHAEGRDCASCHRTDAISAPHEQPVEPHQACDACHTSTTVATLVPVRSFCLTCHSDEVDHYTPKECTTCHFQRTPAELQPRLQRTAGRS